MKCCFCCSCYCCCCCSCCCCYCSCWSYKPTFKVWLKSGEEQLRYWWHWVCVVGGGDGWSKVIFVSHPTFELSWGWVGVVTIFPSLYLTPSLLEQVTLCGTPLFRYQHYNSVGGIMNIKRLILILFAIRISTYIQYSLMLYRTFRYTNKLRCLKQY